MQQRRPFLVVHSNLYHLHQSDTTRRSVAARNQPSHTREHRRGRDRHGGARRDASVCGTGTILARRMTTTATSTTAASAVVGGAANAIMRPIATRATCSRRTSTCHVAVSAGPFGSATVSTRSTAPRVACWRPSAPFGLCPRPICTTCATIPIVRVGALEHLEHEGLIRTSPLSSDDRAVTLTDRGRDLLEANRYERHDRTHEPRQTFHAGIRKPRELTHDTKVYRAYQRAEERLRGQGGRVRRVVLDYELKRDYQRFLHERNRGKKDCDGRPDREPEEDCTLGAGTRVAVRRWARPVPGCADRVPGPRRPLAA